VPWFKRPSSTVALLPSGAHGKRSYESLSIRPRWDRKDATGKTLDDTRQEPAGKIS